MFKLSVDGRGGGSAPSIKTINVWENHLSLVDEHTLVDKHMQVDEHTRVDEHM